MAVVVAIQKKRNLIPFQQKSKQRDLVFGRRLMQWKKHYNSENTTHAEVSLYYLLMEKSTKNDQKLSYLVYAEQGI